MVASATAWADLGVGVDRAQASERVIEQQVGQLTVQKGQLYRRYQEQVATVDRLKTQKASWRLTRELNKAQADAADTATRLQAIDSQIARAQQNLSAAKKALVAAIDAELASATGARAGELVRLRAQLVPAPAAKKIVIPNSDIDPLADPQELDQQAAALVVIEKQLDAQEKGLAQQEKDLRVAFELRKAHERTHEMSTQDDDQPHRAAERGGAGRESAQSPAAGTGAGGDGGGGTFNDKTPTTTALESSAVVLGEVIDRSTIDGLVKASRSGDPKQRADAAAAARAAVAKRIEELRKKRQMIEQRAKQLRK